MQPTIFQMDAAPGKPMKGFYAIDLDSKQIQEQNQFYGFLKEGLHFLRMKAWKTVFRLLMEGLVLTDFFHPLIAIFQTMFET